MEISVNGLNAAVISCGEAEDGGAPPCYDDTGRRAAGPNVDIYTRASAAEIACSGIVNLPSFPFFTTCCIRFVCV